MMGARSSSKGSASMGHETVLFDIGRVIAGATEVRCAKLIELCSPSACEAKVCKSLRMNRGATLDENNSPSQKGAARRWSLEKTPRGRAAPGGCPFGFTTCQDKPLKASSPAVVFTTAVVLTTAS